MLGKHCARRVTRITAPGASAVSVAAGGPNVIATELTTFRRGIIRGWFTSL